MSSRFSWRVLGVAVCAALTVPASAQYIGGRAPPLPQAPAAGVVETPSDSLARSIRILAGSPRDFPALMAAGRAELELGDLSAAAGFFGRADEVRPGDPAPKVGMGGALVQTGDAQGALTWFGQAQSLGASAALLGADRGLAHDLLGELVAAQSDYRAALNGPMPDEARRRLALSLAIGGRMGEGLSILQPLLNRREPAAQRVRAFVLALGGQKVAAMAAIDQAMPGASTGIGRFFETLPRLTAIQKAAAVHLGVFPTATEMAAIANVAPPLAGTKPGFRPPASAQSSPLPSETATAQSIAPRLPPTRVSVAPVRETTAIPAPKSRPRRTDIDEDSLRTVAAIGGFVTKRRRVHVTSEAVPPITSTPPTEPLSPLPTERVVTRETLPLESSSTDVDVAAADRLSGIDKILASSREPIEALAGNTLPEPQPDAALPDDSKTARKLAARAAAVEKKVAAAKKAAADEKAAVKKAADTAAAAERARAAKLGVPGDHWVQLAGGTNEERMATEFKRIKGKKPALFAGRAGYATVGKDYFRLLVGPFGDADAARDFAAKLAKAGIEGFSWPRTPAQIRIEKLPTK